MDMSKLYRAALLALLLPFATASGHDIPTPTVTKDDSEVIISRLKESMDAYGLITVEQHTGRLLFNPLIEKLQTMPVKQKFILPAMIVNQKNGLKIVDEVPFSCFLITGNELTSENYKGYKQFETARYIRDVKNKTISRVLLCQAVGLVGARTWGRDLALENEGNNFVFEEHKGLSGEQFYYFLNGDGLFEMYI